MDEESLRAMMPMGFGKAHRPRATAKAQQSASSTDSVAISSSKNTLSPRQLRPQLQGQEEDIDEDGLTAEEREANRRALEQAADDDGISDDDSEVDLGPEPQGPDISASLPLDDKVVLKDHTKAVSALSIDAAGARIATGSYDYDVKLWDFGGMSQTFKPFKTFEPAESYLVHDTAWSPTGAGDRLLVATGTAQARLYDRDGYPVATYKKGDVYIRDMKHTSGHVAELTSCFWHPSKADVFATTSADSTVRLWNAEDTTKQQTVVVVKSKERGTRTKVTCGAYSHDGATLAVGCLDGALHLYSTSGTYSRPNATIEGAHVRNTETSSTCFSKDGRTLATRGGDGDATVKLWDVRMFKKPLAQCDGLHNAYAQTNVIFSTDESALLTGTSVKRMETRDGSMGKVVKNGGIEVLSRATLEPLKHIDIEETIKSNVDPSFATSVIRLAWHPRINQLFTGTSSGAVHLFFSHTASTRGALLCIDKQASLRRQTNTRQGDEDEEGEGFVRGPIITPGSSDAQERGQGFGAASKRRKMEKARQDPRQSRIPQRPLEGQGRGGRIGAAATQYMVAGMIDVNARAEDPREALLKYADKAQNDPQWTRAWKQTQPEPNLHDDHHKDQEDN